MPNLRFYNAGLALLFFSAISARADTFTIDTADRGYYYSYDFNDTSNKNYFTGQFAGDVDATGFHSFFAFDPLSGLTGPIVSATLNLYNPANGHFSSQLSELLTIAGFSGDVAALQAGGTVSGEYNALASGTVFGTQSVSSANDDAFVSIALNADAIAFLNANVGTAFAFGGYLDSVTNSDTRFMFGGSSALDARDGATTLTIVTESTSPVPEPKALGLSIIGLLALTIRYRKVRAA
jgi:hypothetical protein